MIALMRPLFWKALLVLAGAVAILAAEKCHDDHIRQEERHEVKIDSVTRVIKQIDSVLVHDTVTRREVLTKYRTARDTLTLTDTVQVKVALERADTVIVRDSVALADAGAAIQARDALITLLKRPTREPWLRPYAEVLYAPIGKQPVILGGGLSMRLPLGLSLEAGASTDRRLTIGVRRVF